MRTATRLGLYAASVAVAFGAAFAITGATIPKTVAQDRMAAIAQGQDHMAAMGQAQGGNDALTPGVTLAAGGYQLGPVSAQPASEPPAHSPSPSATPADSRCASTRLPMRRTCT
ncbi:hypothetical protein AHiyo8_pI68360 (plasmid) [Arthrobacter sp. Hiyo8]|nr:hypothetical protein AHiyo8_pI68360 [Arthrobacter sp. Hiyo8]